MSPAIPLTIELEEPVHQAVRLRAAKDGASPAALVNDILRKALAAEIEEAAGVPPLAALVQTHHDRQQGARRSKSQRP